MIAKPAATAIPGPFHNADWAVILGAETQEGQTVNQHWWESSNAGECWLSLILRRRGNKRTQSVAPISSRSYNDGVCNRNIVLQGHVRAVQTGAIDWIAVGSAHPSARSAGAGSKERCNDVRGVCKSLRGEMAVPGSGLVPSLADARGKIAG